MSNEASPRPSPRSSEAVALPAEVAGPALTGEPSPHFGLDIPFMRELGLVAVSLQADRALARMPYDRRLTNSRGDFHGGALMGALDFMLSVAARLHDPLNIGVITIEMSTHFVASARTEVSVESRLIRRGARIAFCEGSVSDADGTVLCLARGAFKLVPRHRDDPRGDVRGDPRGERGGA